MASTAEPVPTVIIDDHKGMLEAVASYLDGTAGFAVAGSFHTVAAALARYSPANAIFVTDSRAR